MSSVSRIVGATVLVVEDDDDTRDLYVLALRTAGFQVEEARNGYQALRSVAQCPPDLVLLDLRMPKLDGWAVLDRFVLRHLGVPIVVVTADSTTTHHEMLRAGGASRIVVKPCLPTDLVQVVRGVLDGVSSA